MTKQGIIRSVLVMLLSVLFVTVLSFLLMRLSPVDPATAYVMRNSPIVTAEQIEEARVMLGMDKPIYVQYFTWLKDALQGNMEYLFLQVNLYSNFCKMQFPSVLQLSVCQLYL